MSEIESQKTTQQIDCYQKGAKMLGDERLSVRQAGVFALQQLAETDPANYFLTIDKTLRSFIGNRGETQWKDGKKDSEEKLIAADHQFAITAILDLFQNERIPSHFKTNHLSLHKLNLRRANLGGVNLKGADLSGADLTEANLKGANLAETNLHMVILKGANLSGANLHKAYLHWANLIEAALTNTKLAGAILIQADLTRADLSGADLSGADLSDADLVGVNLIGANLTRANFDVVDMRGADLTEANVSKTNFHDLNNAIGMSAGYRVVEDWVLTGFKQSHNLDEAQFPDDLIVTGSNEDGWTITLNQPD